MPDDRQLGQPPFHRMGKHPGTQHTDDEKERRDLEYRNADTRHGRRYITRGDGDNHGEEGERCDVVEDGGGHNTACSLRGMQAFAAQHDHSEGHGRSRHS